MTNSSPFYEFTLPSFSDLRGNLIPVEFPAEGGSASSGNEKFPFSVKRVYFLKNVPPETTRGAHCHHVEEEVFVCIKGKCRALIDADGNGKKEVWLNTPNKAIYVGTKVWHEFDSFSKDAVLMAFSSTHYFPGEDNYETGYEEFLKTARN